MYHYLSQRVGPLQRNTVKLETGYKQEEGNVRSWRGRLLTSSERVLRLPHQATGHVQGGGTLRYTVS